MGIFGGGRVETGAITGRFSVSSLLSEDDLIRLRMGRLIRREEIEGRQLLYFSGKARFLQHLLGLGMDWTRPAVRSSRPRTADGRQSFVFSHRTVSKRRWLTAGQTPSAKPALRGVGPGTAKKFSAYIRRAKAVEQHNGRAAIAGTTEAFLPDFWDAVEARERTDGRLQSRIAAELPYEEEVGPEGRRRILERLGDEFDSLGLPWMGVVHRPDAHSDRRNYHLHLIYHDRQVAETPGGDLLFAQKKCSDCRDRGFIPRLRKRYAALVNDEFKRARLKRRWDPRRYDQIGIAKEPCEHLGVKAAALERKGIATRVGSRNVAREFAYRVRLTEQDVAMIASETLRTIERAKVAAGYVEQENVPRELTDATSAFVEATIIYVDWRSLEASRLIKLSLAQWVREAMPSRLIQVARTDRVESEPAGQMADYLLWRLTNRIGVLTDALDRMRLNADEARQRLTQAERRFEDEVLLHRLARCRESIVRLRRRQATADGKLTEQQWADRRRRWQQQRSSALAELRHLHRELANDILPHLFRGLQLLSFQEGLSTRKGKEELRDVLESRRADDTTSAWAARAALERLDRMDQASSDASWCQDKLGWMDQVDADPHRRQRKVLDPVAQTAPGYWLEVESENLESLMAKICQRPDLLRLAKERRLTAPIIEHVPTTDAEPAQHSDASLPARATDDEDADAKEQQPLVSTRQPSPPAGQPVSDRTAEPDQPKNETVEPLKLGSGEDATPLLARKSDEQLLAMRKVTLEELKLRRGEIGEWATAHRDKLKRGLKTLDVHLAERGVKTEAHTLKPYRRNRGFEL